jgi:hypothetical protein
MQSLQISGLTPPADPAACRVLESTFIPSAFRRSLFTLIAVAAVLGSSTDLEAASHRSKSPTKARASSKAKSKATSGHATVASHKVAVFAFEGDDAEPLRKHVIQALSDRGLRVETSLKPQDNPEQYRDLGATLDLAAYVHGHVKGTGGDHAVATVVVRSAVTGRKVATATFTGFRRGLPFDVEEQLWGRVGPAFTRVCIEASKPGRRHNEPMRIEAGTPL